MLYVVGFVIILYMRESYARYAYILSMLTISSNGLTCTDY